MELNKCEYKVSRVMSIDRPIRYDSNEKKANLIIDIISEHTGITPNLWIVRHRKREHVFNRHLYYYLMSEYSNATLKLLQHILINHEQSSDKTKQYDHSTVINSRNRIRDIIFLGRRSENFETVAEIEKKVKQKLKYINKKNVS